MKHNHPKTLCLCGHFRMQHVELALDQRGHCMATITAEQTMVTSACDCHAYRRSPGQRSDDEKTKHHHAPHGPKPGKGAPAVYHDFPSLPLGRGRR